MFIVIEGTDGSGKATQSRLLAERLRKHGHHVQLVSFPRYGTDVGKLVRKYLDGGFGKKEDIAPEFAALLYALDRYAFKTAVEKMLAEGTSVVCDRYTESNLAHQGAKFALGSGRQEFIAWLEVVESRLPKPGVKFFLDVPIGATEHLMRNRKKDVHETDAQYLEQTREVYRFLTKQQSGWHAISCMEPVNGKQQLLSKEKIHEKIWAVIRQQI